MARCLLLPACGMLLSTALLLGRVRARAEFVDRIPNGAGVGAVRALGHVEWDGSGGLNNFGKAFAAAGYKWTVALCKGDADGDGQTNGDELGDPCCLWMQGDAPIITAPVSHPGDVGSKLDEASLGIRRMICRAAEQMVASIEAQQIGNSSADASTSGASAGSDEGSSQDAGTGSAESSSTQLAGAELGSGSHYDSSPPSSTSGSSETGSSATTKPPSTNPAMPASNGANHAHSVCLFGFGMALISLVVGEGM